MLAARQRQLWGSSQSRRRCRGRPGSAGRPPAAPRPRRPAGRGRGSRARAFVHRWPRSSWAQCVLRIQLGPVTMHCRIHAGRVQGGSVESVQLAGGGHRQLGSALTSKLDSICCRHDRRDPQSIRSADWAVQRPRDYFPPKPSEAGFVENKHIHRSNINCMRMRPPRRLPRVPLRVPLWPGHPLPACLP